MKLTIIGASGHGKVVADIAKKCGYDDIEFLDDNENIKYCGKYLVVGKTSEFESIDNDIFVAIGNSKIRKNFIHLLENKTIPTLIHPNAVIADDVEIGIGSVVMAGAVINSDTVIGDGVIVNTCSSIDHDCEVGNFSHIAVGAHLCGNVKIGKSTWMGAGATVSNNVDICDNCVIGAGAVVVKNINDSGVYIGVPAKKIYEVK